tara:strand:- start:7163 stop:7654 length:492 start_codon:yes stop_codon:yes gene_type:complete
MSLYTYIAENNPTEANNLLNNYGFKQTDSYDELIVRLKTIVRKYKKVALQDIVEIHPDKKLINSFTKSEFSDKEFSYATGRTPGFAEPDVVPESNFEKPVSNTSTEDVLAQIKEVKEQVVRNRSRGRNKKSKGNIVGQRGMIGQTEFLMVAVAFALGYLIGKK